MQGADLSFLRVCLRHDAEILVIEVFIARVFAFQVRSICNEIIFVSKQVLHWLENTQRHRFSRCFAAIYCEKKSSDFWREN